jgi:hypothetical protein
MWFPVFLYLWLGLAYAPRVPREPVGEPPATKEKV